jgi:hypothetical protein
MTVDILGTSYAVRAVKEVEGGKLLGQCDSAGGIITIERGLAPSVLRNVLVHEMMHAVSDILALNLSERQVSGLTAGLLSIPQLTLRVDK